jgi:tetratricopeptide (TPR) repeat protein
MNTNSLKVTWLSDASRDLDQSLLDQAGRELIHVFASSGAKEIVVTQRFSGFSDEPQKKLIIAVEIQFLHGSNAHVVKLGDTDQVDGDCAGWDQCATRQGIASRMFIAPVSGLISEHRQAVIYSDVYQYYFDNGRDDKPQELEFVVQRAIHNNAPTYTSIERVLTQVFTEAHRCFYKHAKVDTTSQHIVHGVLRSLRVGESHEVLERWQQPDFLQLRRDTSWLTAVHRTPDSIDRPAYIDPVDFMRWVCEPTTRATGVALDDQAKNPRLAPTAHNARFPEMLVGPAHGDLHGRNIIVGTMRDEAEWPAVFDFDKMANDNIVAWDFAKLELELKCRLFQQLLDSTEERDQLRKLLDTPVHPQLPESLRLSPEESAVQQRAEMLELIFAIEQRLDSWTKQLKRESLAKRMEASFVGELPTNTPIGRAMQIIFRIRKEAAIYLGFERHREDRWLAEYYFALACYGVVSAKWHSANDNMAWALVSAGVASAALPQFSWPPSINESPDPATAVSHLQLLPYSHRCWKKGKSLEPIELLRHGIAKFPHAIGLNQQLALCLAASGSEVHQTEAEREVSSIARLAVVFRDFETLCRLGRVYKDRGDAEYSTKPDGRFTYQQMLEKYLPAYQHYHASFKFYNTAYEVSQNYYPAINAATLALLIGSTDQQQKLAQAVLHACSHISLDGPDSIWVLASEGEAALLIGDVDSAVRFYRSALQKTLPQETGIIQSMYNQLCRLHWALGKDIVQPVIDLFMSNGRLESINTGPFGNCGRQ